MGPAPCPTCADAVETARGLANAVRAFFAPGPGCAVPVPHAQTYGEPHLVTWNTKLAALTAALAAYDAAGKPGS